MTIRKPNRPRDLSQRAKMIVDIASDNVDAEELDKKDPSAVERGRKGGKTGGKTRASRMSAEQRSHAARKAAQARWSR